MSYPQYSARHAAGRPRGPGRLRLGVLSQEQDVPTHIPPKEAPNRRRRRGSAQRVLSIREVHPLRRRPGLDRRVALFFRVMLSDDVSRNGLLGDVATRVMWRTTDRLDLPNLRLFRFPQRIRTGQAARTSLGSLAELKQCITWPTWKAAIPNRRVLAAPYRQRAAVLP